MPVTWAEWPQFWYAWNDQVATGVNPVIDPPLLLYHLLTAVASLRWPDPVALQKLLVMCWFPLAGVGMYRLVTWLVKGPASLSAGLVAASFYLYNLWQETIWMGFKPPLVVGYALLPFLLQLVLEAVARRRPWPQTMAWLLFASLPMAVIWYNPTEAVAIVAPLLLALGLAAGRDRRRLRWGAVALMMVGWTLLNAFWLIPQTLAILAQFAGPEFQHLQKTVVLSWLQGLSAYTSVVHVTQLQGDWAWHSGMVDPYRVHAIVYAQSPWLYGLSWIMPGAALYGLIRSRSPHRVLFSLLAVFGIILGTGTHPPFGAIYQWLFDHVPLFWTMRSPYYKFGFWIVLGYGALTGLAIAAWAARHPTAWRRRGGIATAMLVAVQLVYAYPVVTGRMFTFAKERTFLFPDRVQIPAYVKDAAQWLEGQRPRGRILAVPGDPIWVYTWGYVGYGSVIHAFTTVPLLFDAASEYMSIAMMASQQSSTVTKAVVHAWLGRATRQTAGLLRLLGVRYVLQENDVRYDLYKGAPFAEHDSPRFMKETLSAQEGVSLARRFGEWDLYEVQGSQIQTIMAEQVAVAQGPLSALLIPLAETPLLDSPTLVFTEQQPSRQGLEALRAGGLIGAVVTDGTAPDPILQEAAASSSRPVWLVMTWEPSGAPRRQVVVPRAGTWGCRALVYREKPMESESPAVTLAIDHRDPVSLRRAPTPLSWPAGTVDVRLQWPAGAWCAVLCGQPGDAPWRPPHTVVGETRRDPTRYTVELPGGGPAVLMFHEAAHPGWELRQQHRRSGVPLIVNGHAQGWVLPSPRAEGTYDLEFGPQRWVVIGAAVSLAALGGLMMGAVVMCRRTRP